jgi:peptidoglycan/LPS O-acetylase OafA/YrhL
MIQAGGLGKKYSRGLQADVSLRPVSGVDAGRVPELDGLRGLAIGMVLVFHYFWLTVQARPASLLAYAMVPFRLTWSGVDLFFVLSGFLIGGILLDARTSTNYFQIFYTRRFFRIVPIYAAVLLLFPALAYIAHHAQHDGLVVERLPWYFYWTFTQNLWMARTASLGAGMLAVTWSLAVEEQFYITLPLIVRFVSGRRLLACVMAGIGLAPLTRIAIRLIWPHNSYAAFVLMPCRADALLLGVLGAMLIRNNVWKARIQRNNLFFAISVPIFLLGIAFLNLKSPALRSPLMQTFGYTWLALFYLSVLLFTVTRPQTAICRALRFRWLRWLGGIAYGTYLLHQFIQRILFGYFWGHEPRITGGYTFLTALSALAVTLAISQLSWRYFENHLIRFGRRSSYTFAESSSKAMPQSAT